MPMTILITEDDADPERVDVLAGHLREELLQLEVDDVRRAPGDAAPDDARAVDAATVGALLVSVAAATTALDEIITVVRTWVNRGPRTVKVTVDGDTLELTHATRAQQDELIQAFRERRRR